MLFFFWFSWIYCHLCYIYLFDVCICMCVCLCVCISLSTHTEKPLLGACPWSWLFYAYDYLYVFLKPKTMKAWMWLLDGLVWVLVWLGPRLRLLRLRSELYKFDMLSLGACSEAFFASFCLHINKLLVTNWLSEWMLFFVVIFFFTECHSIL